MADNKEELFPVVDEAGNVIGRMTRGEAHGGSLKLHPVVHLHVFDRYGRLYLQFRPLWKDIQPSRWDTATGGHVDYGETVAQALQREVREELGITDFEPTFLTCYVFASKRERELVNVFATVYDGPITPNPDELSGGRFWTPDEIAAAIAQGGVVTPNFAQEYQRIVGLPALKALIPTPTLSKGGNSCTGEVRDL